MALSKENGRQLFAFMPQELKRKYLGFPRQIDIQWCKASVACESTSEIHHDGVNHWLVLANISRVVNVYNSLYQGSHNENIKSLLSLFY